MLRTTFFAVFRAYTLSRLIGVAVHETAHAGAVIVSGGRITEFDITSHVEHEGRYSLAQQLTISYAPLVVNTLLAGLLAFGAMGLPQTEIPSTLSTQVGDILPVPAATLGLQAAALTVAFSLGATALPSVEDALSPYQRVAHQFRHPTIKGLVLLPFELPILVVFVVPLAFAYVRSKSFVLSIVSEIGFAVVVLAQATGTVNLLYYVGRYSSEVI